MNCDYSFYSDVASHRGTKTHGFMSMDTAKILIDKVFLQIKSDTTVTFSFQGGEPTLVGLDFYRQFTEYAKQNKTKNITLAFSIQTNGFVLDEDWCLFFYENSFLVGISFG